MPNIPLDVARYNGVGTLGPVDGPNGTPRLCLRLASAKLVLVSYDPGPAYVALPRARSGQHTSYGQQGARRATRRSRKLTYGGKTGSLVPNGTPLRCCRLSAAKLGTTQLPPGAVAAAEGTGMRERTCTPRGHSTRWSASWGEPVEPPTPSPYPANPTTVCRFSPGGIG